jgi:queuine tRNA-ribosyltransferase
MTAPLLPPEAPVHLLGIGDIDDLLAGIALGLDVFDCAIPTRLARHGTALVPDPEGRFRLDLRKGGWAGSREPIAAGCPCPACRHHDRDYLSYLSRAEELTAVRLLCLHNLTYLHQLVAGAREAIINGAFESYSASILSGAAPWDAAARPDPRQLS